MVQIGVNRTLLIERSVLFLLVCRAPGGQQKEEPCYGTAFHSLLKGKDHAMETYIMMTRLTEQGRKTVKENPKRINEVNKEVESMGGKVLAQYAVLGPFDFVNVVQAPDNKTIAKISVELSARGTIEIMTLPVVNITS